ncbi:MAG: hypothetical protein QOF25_2866 [Mycobacterium sp.]|jgi:hypothetical protein|nr:hypothetical protein [Mycobacterium sp.]
MGVDAVPVSYIAILVDTTGAGFPHRGTLFPPSVTGAMRRSRRSVSMETGQAGTAENRSAACPVTESTVCHR